VRYEKLLWTLALVCVVFPGYWAIGLHQDPEHAHRLVTALDNAVPYRPEWMFVYGGVYTALLLPCFVVKDDALFRRVALAYLFTLLVSFAVFLAYPVTTAHFRPEVATLDTRIFWQWGAALNYTIDPPMNCFPSLHVGTMTLATLVTLRVDKVIGSLAVAIALLIALSTLLVKQHYLADVFAGAAVATLAYNLFIKDWDPAGKSEMEIRQPRWAVLLYFGLYLFAIVGILLPLYIKDVKPWVKDVAPVSSRS
jgi:membrane-associated phospholipid phosphatase